MCRTSSSPPACRWTFSTGRYAVLVAPAAGERLAQQGLVVAPAVHVGAVEEVHAVVDGVVDDLDALGIVALAVGARQRHAAEADQEDAEARAAQLGRLGDGDGHGFLVLRLEADPRSNTGSGQATAARPCGALLRKARSERSIAVRSRPSTMNTSCDRRSASGHAAMCTGGCTRCCTPCTATGVAEPATFRMPLTRRTRTPCRFSSMVSQTPNMVQSSAPSKASAKACTEPCEPSAVAGSARSSCRER